MKTDVGVSANQRGRARPMRGAPTEAERRLWRLLRDRRLSELKFRRQVPVGPYIVDFPCVSARLIVEADGSQHGDNRHDEVRDAYLATQGWKVLRFWNSDILRNRDSVLDTIIAHANPVSGASPHPALRATFSPREKVSIDGPEDPSPSGGRWRAEGVTDEGRGADGSVEDLSANRLSRTDPHPAPPAAFFRRKTGIRTSD